MNSIGRVVSVVGTLLGVFAWPAVTNAAWYAKFDGIDGSTTTAAVGAEFDVLVGSDTDLAAFGQLGSYTFELSFDEKVLRLGVLDDVFDGAPVSIVPTSTGIRVSASGVAGSSLGDYARITFKAAAVGLSGIALTTFDAFGTQAPSQPFPPQVISPNSLTVAIVPEPSAAMLALLSTGGFALLRLRR